MYVQVDEALSEIHESISELAMLLQKDEISSQVVQTVPTQWTESPSPSIASLNPGSHPPSRDFSTRDDLTPGTGMTGSREVHQQGCVTLVPPHDSLPADGDVDVDKAANNGDLSYDLSMSYSVLGNSRHFIAAGNDHDLTSLSMNQSHDDGGHLSARPHVEQIVEDSPVHLQVSRKSMSEDTQFESIDPSGCADESRYQVGGERETRRQVMGDFSQALQTSAENISVTVSDVTGSMHDTCELSKCEVSKCSPSPQRRGNNHITPKVVEPCMILSPSPPPKAGLGIKFKQPQRGSGFPVAAVVPGGPADCAGISAGDILMFVASNTMTTTSSSKHVAMSIAHAGSSLHIILRRANQLKAALVRRNTGPFAAAAPSTIGTAIAKDPSRNPHICSVAAGSPAEDAGILAGDEVVAVGSQCVASLQREHLLEQLAGDNGSLVVLGLVRPGTASGLEWVALRRRNGVPMHIHESNGIVPKTVHGPMYATQENKYTTQKTAAHSTQAVPPSQHLHGAMPARSLQSCTLLADVDEHGSDTSAATLQPGARNTLSLSAMTMRPPNSIIHMPQNTDTLSCETHAADSNGRYSTYTGDPQLHAAARNPQHYANMHRHGASVSSQAYLLRPSGTEEEPQPLVLRHSSLSTRQHSLPQHVVAVGGATVSMCDIDMYMSRSSSTSTATPSATRAAPKKVSVLHSSLASKPDTLYRSHVDANLHKTAAAGVSVSGARGSTIEDAEGGGKAENSPSRHVTLGKPIERFLGTPVDTQFPMQDSHDQINPTIGLIGGKTCAPGNAPPHSSSLALRSNRSASSGGRVSGGGGAALMASKTLQELKDLKGDALVAVALEHIQNYESRRVVITEHSRRLDTDIS